MNLVNELAYVCAASQTKRAALDDAELRDIREQFEGLEAQEGHARAHAGRLEDLAKLRSSREDTTPQGYAETFGKRMVPIPYTLGEAAVRGAGTAAGGVAGAMYGKALETLDPDAAKAVVSPEKGLRFATGAGSEVAPIVKALQNMGLDEDAAMGLAQRLSKEAPETIAGALQETRLPIVSRPAAQEALRADITAALAAKAPTPAVTPGKAVEFLGEGQIPPSVPAAATVGKAKGTIPQLRTEVGNLIRQAQKDKGVTSSIMSALKSKRLLGGAAGVGAGALLTGLPFALRALYQKRQGGEGAVRARGYATQARAEAGESARRRDVLLEKLK